MNSIHRELIDIIKQKTPQEINSVDLLINILPMSKEAAYRRLRGEIPFSLEEAVKITHKLNFSLDNIIFSNTRDFSKFSVSVSAHNPSPLRDYVSVIQKIKNAYIRFESDEEAVYYNASNVLPNSFFLKYEQLTKFRIFKMMFQQMVGSYQQTFSEFELPEDVMVIQKECLYESEKIKTNFIWDEHTFGSFVKNISYIKKLNLIDDFSLKLIKEELNSMMNEIEQASISGKFKSSGQDVYMYISPIIFDTSYSYLKGEKYQICSVGLYDLNYISSLEPDACAHCQRWIESLIRHSILVSRSGEMQRKAYFQKQKEYIDLL